MNDALLTLMSYQLWADSEFLDKLELLDKETNSVEYEAGLRLMDHINVVARIFSAHLSRENHGFLSDKTIPTPALAELRASIEQTDRWYLDYVQSLSQDELRERISFAFTDGDKGSMSRGEMLMHVVLHGAVHRGEIGRILSQIGADLPWDTLAVFLHSSEPARRR